MAAVRSLYTTESGGTNLGDVDHPELDSEQLPAILRLKTTRVKR
jgi:hypothetical protein